MNYRLWIRVAFGYLTVASLQIGVWGLLAPQSFNDKFPGLDGRTWIAADGPYNEHLIRDVGALNLALFVVLVSAAVTVSKPVVYVAAGAAAAWGIPHFAYHAFNTEGLSNSDIVVSLGGLAAFAVLPLVIVFIAKSHLEVEESSI